jgi:hypothetical protein
MGYAIGLIKPAAACMPFMYYVAGGDFCQWPEMRKSAA